MLVQILNLRQRGTSETNQLQWNEFVRTCLEGTIAHLEFSIEIQSNNLTYQGNPYTERQQYLYKLIKSMHDSGLGYRKISRKLNEMNIKTIRGNSWFNTSVSSVLKRKHERDLRIQEIRNKKFKTKIGKFSVKYYTF